MHAAHIQTMEIQQAVLPAPANDAARRSSANEPFSLAWQRELSTGSATADETAFRSAGKAQGPAQPKMNTVEDKSSPEPEPAAEGREPLREDVQAGTPTKGGFSMRPSATPESLLNAMPETGLNATPDTRFNATPVARPNATPVTSGNATPNPELNVTPRTNLNATPDAKPSAVPVERLNVTPDARPNVTPDAKPSAVPVERLNAAPDTKPNVAPDTMLNATPDTMLNAAPDTMPNATPASKPAATQTARPISTPSAKTSRPSVATPAATPAVDAKKKHRMQVTTSDDSIQTSKPSVDAAPQIADVAVAVAQAGVATAAIRIDTTTASALPAGPEAVKMSATGTKRQIPSDATGKNAVVKTPLATDPRADVGAQTSMGKVAEGVATAASAVQSGESQWAAMAVDHGMHSNPAGLSAGGAGGFTDAGTQHGSTPGLTPGHVSPALHAGAELRSEVLNMTGASSPVPSQGHQMLAASPRQLEVGLVDGTHGWLQIRAELGVGGAVSASLTGSAVAHESLRQAVPELASFLESEAVSVSKIAVHRAAESSPAMGQAQDGSGQQGQAQGGRESQQNAGGDAGASGKDSQVPSGYEIGPASGPASSAPDVTAGNEVGQPNWMRDVSPAVFGGGMSFGVGGGSGSWLNVLA